MNSLLPSTLFFSLGLLSTHAIVVDNYSASTNDRFANDPSFIGASFDWSGVGRDSSQRTATLIGDNYFVSADHWHPDGDVTFYTSNDPTEISFTYTVAGGCTIEGTDLWLGYFEEIVDSSIARYSYSTTAATSLAETGITGTTYMYGKGGGSYTGGVLTSVRVAENQVDALIQDVSYASLGGTSFDSLVVTQNLDGDTNFQTHEGLLETGDSGSPLFSVSEGVLHLEGIASAVGTVTGTFGPGPPGQEREASFYNYLGSYDLNTCIDTFPKGIPEPSTGLLLTMICTCLAFNRARVSQGSP